MIGHRLGTVAVGSTEVINEKKPQSLVGLRPCEEPPLRLELRTYALRKRGTIDATDISRSGLRVGVEFGCTNGCTAEREHDCGSTFVESVDPELAKILAAWSDVPEHLKAVAVANVLALVATAQNSSR